MMESAMSFVEEKRIREYEIEARVGRPSAEGGALMYFSKIRTKATFIPKRLRFEPGVRSATIRIAS
jgi:hypothetical protein